MAQLTWISDGGGTVAQQLRRDIRAHRREKGRGGHRFKYAELKELHAGFLPGGEDPEAPIHVVLTHDDDPVWQHWARHSEDGWILCGWFADQRAATVAAEAHSWDYQEEESVPDGREPGIYVLAGWEEDKYTMSTHCRTRNVAITVADTYRAMGCVTSQEIVS